MPRITYIKPKDEMIMYCDKPIIILPEKISVLRDVKNQSIYTDLNSIRYIIKILFIHTLKNMMFRLSVNLAKILVIVGGWKSLMT